MVNWTELRKTLLVPGRSFLPPSIKLPALPVAIIRFSDRANDPDVSIAELGQIIETDAGLTTELLRYVNSAAVGMRQKASAVSQAINMLGVNDTRLFLLTAAVKRSMKATQSKLMNIPAFWATNLERALFARIVARLLKADAELAFSAAMLQDFLLPILSNEAYSLYLEFANQQMTQPGQLVDFEKEKLRWTHAEAAAQVMQSWSFPDDLVCCVALHHHGLKLLGHPQLGKSAAAAVAVSALMPCALRQTPDGLPLLIRLEKAWPAFDLGEVAARVETEFKQLSPGAQNAFTFRRAVEKTLAGAR